ncbi:hypothetical protein PCL_05038 [Purpureocillium lilacinum]|uniref:Uncharacterized protein n=1 Tax=Purpureocillium lilacinum TaxID=33203 RepID=A0A2U3DVR0_PURLI|nr:hypothetical protein Purlil1_10960 [Purpureocillium lilacinum]PWI66340.1 hypothetical protein PCL_05038 [Purpureocillium lilacinum]
MPQHSSLPPRAELRRGRDETRTPSCGITPAGKTAPPLISSPALSLSLDIPSSHFTIEPIGLREPKTAAGRKGRAGGRAWWLPPAGGRGGAWGSADNLAATHPPPSWALFFTLTHPHGFHARRVGALQLACMKCTRPFPEEDPSLGRSGTFPPTCASKAVSAWTTGDDVLCLAMHRLASPQSNPPPEVPVPTPHATLTHTFGSTDERARKRARALAKWPVVFHAAAMCWRRRPLLTVPPSIPEGSMCPPWYHDFLNKEPSNITQTPTQEAVRPPNANQVYPPPDRALVKESPTP